MPTVNNLKKYLSRVCAVFCRAYASASAHAVANTLTDNHRFLNTYALFRDVFFSWARANQKNTQDMMLWVFKYLTFMHATIRHPFQWFHNRTKFFWEPSPPSRNSIASTIDKTFYIFSTVSRDHPKSDSRSWHKNSHEKSYTQQLLIFTLTHSIMIIYLTFLLFKFLSSSRIWWYSPRICFCFPSCNTLNTESLDKVGTDWITNFVRVWWILQLVRLNYHPLVNRTPP